MTVDFGGTGAWIVDTGEEWQETRLKRWRGSKGEF